MAVSLSTVPNIFRIALFFVCFYFSFGTIVYDGPEELHEGEPLELSCQKPANHPALWTLNDQSITDLNITGVVMSEEEDGTSQILKLEIPEVSRKHEGSYRCDRYSREAHYLSVFFPDKYEAIPSIKFEIGKPLTLVCNDNPDDRITYTWYKNDLPLTDQALNPITKGPELRIASPQPRDAGRYQCKVDQVPEDVPRPPVLGQIFNLVYQARVEVESHYLSTQKKANVTLVCRIYGNPKPSFGWLFGNIEISRVDHYAGGVEVEDDSPKDFIDLSLHITEVEDSDQGLYTCFANNSETPVEASIFLAVRESLIETNEPAPGQGVLLKLGEPLVLQCNVSACLDCKIFWYRDGKFLNESSGRYSVFPQNNSLVIVHPSPIEDAGEYICAMFTADHVGPPLVNASLQVVTEPHIVPFGNSRNVVQGESVTLHCKVVQGAPPPSLRWFKGDEPINTSDPRISLAPDPDFGHEGALLTIKNLDFSDRAYYTCEANNGVTNSTRESVLVRVKDKLAALWPFLGICAEVAILCTIIFVYERRKAKSELEGENDDHSKDNSKTISQKSSSEKSKQDIRQRK